MHYIAPTTTTKSTMTHNEALAETYDAQENAILFDGSRWYHKNTEWEGDRYVLVYFNIDFSQHDRWRGLHGPDHQTEDARALPPLTQPVCTPINTSSAECVELRRHLLDEIGRVEFMSRPQLKYEKKSEILLFGECIQPYHAKGRHPCKANENYPALHALLLQYVDFIMQKPVSTAYSTILLAKNSQCTWHLDKQNVSSSILTAIGPFTGGKLRVNHVEPQPLFECLACHMKYHPLRRCRLEQRHTAPDWIPEVWNLVREGSLVLDASTTTRKLIKNNQKQGIAA